MTTQYILDELKRPVPVPMSDMTAWGEWMADFENHRRVAQDEVGAFRVSTVFLGIDHGFGRSDRPVLFETMVFGPADDADLECVRYCTWQEAEIGHAEMLRKVKGWPQPKPPLDGLDRTSDDYGTW
jgi:hypothetical protein